MSWATTILFPGHVRLSTWLTIAAFTYLTVRRRDRLPLLAAATWICGFEVVFDLAAIAKGFPLHFPSLQFFVDMASIAGPALVAAVLTWRGVRPEPRIFVLALAVLAVWLATGFHINEHDGKHFVVSAEVLNETSKTLWAVAYLVPLAVVAVPSPERDRDTRAAA